MSNVALRTGSWDGSATVQIDVGSGGQILGAGGDGGNGNNAYGSGSPGGDGSTTINYKIQWAINSGTAYLGKSDPASVQQRSGGSQFWVMEIAG